MTAQTLTPSERQILLRKLKHGPALSREELAEYAKKIQLQVLAKRKQVK